MSFRPRWGSAVTRPLAQDQVPHVPYGMPSSGQNNNISSVGAPKNAPVGIFNKPLSSLKPLMEQTSPETGSRTKRDELWEKKRDQFLKSKGCSPESTSRPEKQNMSQWANQIPAHTPPKAAASAAPTEMADPFEAAVQALIKKQNETLKEELATAKVNPPSNQAPSPSDPRTDFYKSSRSNGDILSPPQSRLGGRMTSMHTDMDAMVIERRKKEQYRLELEQQMSARRPSSTQAPQSQSPLGIAPPSLPRETDTLEFRGGKKQYATPSHAMFSDASERQAQYKHELDEQIRIKSEHRPSSIPSVTNTVAYPSSTSSALHMPSDKSPGQSKAERVKEYKRQLDEQLLHKREIESWEGQRRKPLFPESNAPNMPQADTRSHSMGYPQRGNQESYRMELDHQIAIKRQSQPSSQERHYGRAPQDREHEDVFSKLGRHEELAVEHRPFGRGLNNLHTNDSEKAIRLKNRKQRYMQDLRNQIQEKNQLCEEDRVRRPMASPLKNQDEYQPQPYGMPSQVPRVVSAADSPYRRDYQPDQRVPMPQRPQNFENVERNLNFAGFAALPKKKPPTPTRHDVENFERRQQELARKKGYGQELMQQAREKKAREALAKQKLREEDERLMEKDRLARNRGVGVMSAAMGTDIGRGGGGGEASGLKDPSFTRQSDRSSSNPPPNSTQVPMIVQRSFSDGPRPTRDTDAFDRPPVSELHYTGNVVVQPAHSIHTDVPRGFARMRSGELHSDVLQDEPQLLKKQAQQDKFRRALKEQVDEQRRRKAEIKRIEREAEEREAERIRRELDDMNRRYHQEKDGASPEQANNPDDLHNVHGAVANSPQRSHLSAQTPRRYETSPARIAPGISNANSSDYVDETFRREMEERQRELQAELEQQRNMVREMQQQMAQAMERKMAQANSNAEQDDARLSGQKEQRRQWATPTPLPTYGAKPDESFDGISQEVTMPPFTGEARAVVQHRRSVNRKATKTPQANVPDQAFVSRPLIRNSLDVSNVSELFAGGETSTANETFAESSFAGHSKLVDILANPETLDKTWMPQMPSLSPARVITATRSPSRNRNALVEQSLQSSSKFVFLNENEISSGTSADEALLNAFANEETDRAQGNISATRPLEPVREESTSPKSATYSGQESPSDKYELVAHFLGVEPMISPSANNRSNPPQTPPRETLNTTDHLYDKAEAQGEDQPRQVNVSNDKNSDYTLPSKTFEVNVPGPEDWEVMLNTSQGSINMADESLNRTDGDTNALNNTAIENVLNATSIEGVDEEVL